MNQLLVQLPPPLLMNLQPHLTAVPLAPRQVLQQPGERIEHVYFPNGGIVSIATVLLDGAMVETATAGKEGMIGIDAFFAEGSVASSQAMVHVPIPGQAAMRMHESDFRRALAESTILRDIVARYAQALHTRVERLAACNARHDVYKRCARWLLSADDQMGGTSFHLTQEFLATMLGVRRQSVGVVASAFRAAGLIGYVHGKITILDRDRLEQASCECYESIARTYKPYADTSKGIVPS